MDAKKSPLALLAQTCSQIGADTSPSAKSLLSSASDKNSSSSNSKKSETRSSPTSKTSTPINDKSRTSPSIPQTESKPLAFKPYETNVLTKKSDETRPPSSSSKTNGSPEQEDKRTPSRKSSDDGLRSSPDRKTPGSSPVIRSGLEVLQGHKDSSLYKPLSGLCCPPGLDANPAFRPPFLGPYPTTTQPQPYLSYARVKTAAGGEALVPVCKDPYCTGCQYSQHNPLLAGAAQHNPLLAGSGQPAACPAGCAQCEHQKQYGLAVAMSIQNAAVAASYAQLTKPYVCNWVAGDATSYCGKRFGNSEELLQHLRTHTGATPSDVASYASALHRAGYPTPGPLSPLSAARYHPYAKPPGLLPGAPLASPYGAFGPAAALGAYYNPYALYAGAQRLGAAAHQ